jgi:hypothetical protein
LMNSMKQRDCANRAASPKRKLASSPQHNLTFLAKNSPTGKNIFALPFEVITI